MAEASEAFSVRECARGKQATKQGASPGVAERARARCAGVEASVFPKCGRQKRLEQKILLLLLLAAAGYGGAGFQLVHKFL